MKKFYALFLILTFAFPFVSSSQTVYQWKVTPTSSTWTEGTNWFGGVSPGNSLAEGDVIIIPYNTSKTPQIIAPFTNNGSFQAGKLFVLFTGSLTNNGTFSVPVYGQALFYSTIENNGTLINNSVLVLNSGAGLNIGSSGKFTNLANFLNNGGLINIYSDATGTGSYIDNSSAKSGTFEQYISSGAWHLVGIPITSAVLDAFDPANGDGYMREFITATNTWGDYMIDPEDILSVGKGYEYYTTDPSTTISLTGTYNTGNVNLTLSSADEGWNLISNPYPCALDWETVSDKTNAVAESIWFYDGNAGAGTNGYAIYNGSTNTGTYGATERIPPFQGFFVQQTGGTSMSFSNANKVHLSDTDNSYYKKEIQEEGIYDRIRLQLTQGEFWSETVVVHTDEATNGFDRMIDTEMRSNNYITAPEIYTKADGHNITINGVGDYPAVIPIEMEFVESGEASINVTEMSDLLGTTLIQIEDRDNNMFYDLSNSFLNINFYAEEGILSDRFYLHYISTVGIEEEDLSDVSIYSSNNNIFVRNTGDEIYDIVIFNTLGQVVYNKGSVQSDLNVQLKNQPTAYYIVRLESDQGITNKKLFITQ